jgi:hypothetical protein
MPTLTVTMKLPNEVSPAGDAQTPHGQKQPKTSPQTAATANRDEVRKTAPPAHAPRQSQRPKERSK